MATRETKAVDPVTAPLPVAVDIEGRARRIKLLLMDVDGTLTDGGLYYVAAVPGREAPEASSGGEVAFAVRFDVRDGLGMAVARQAGLVLGLVSGRDVPQVRQRAAELKLEEVHLGVADKAAVVEEILKRRGLEPEECCFVGDDVVDIPPMALCGLPVAVADAMPAVKDVALWITTARGGHGAIREVVDRILTAQGLI